jgi:DnaJ-class molecular chaperone
MAKKKPKPIGSGNYTVCRKCRGTGQTFDIKKANHPKGQAILWIPCPDCKDGTGQSRGWVDAER